MFPRLPVVRDLFHNGPACEVEVLERGDETSLVGFEGFVRC
jgi:hypothetical protein